MKSDKLTKEYQILQDKINRKIDTAQEKIKPILTDIEREGNIMTDFIAPLGNNNVVSFDANGSLKMNVEASDGISSYSMHTHAVAQAGEKLGVPTGYIKKLAVGAPWQKDLAAHVLNQHSDNSDRSRVLVRAVGNEVRGVLSDHYRRLNTTEIYGSFLDAINRQGGVLVDAHLDPTRTYLESILPHVVSVPTEKNGMVYMVYGMRISNSDFGDGALNVQAYSINVVCTNGMTRQNMMRQIHLGKKLPDNISLSEKTYRLDTETQASLVNDLVSTVFSKDHIERESRVIQLASEMELDLEKEIKKLPKAGMLKSEVEQVSKVLIANKGDDGVTGEGTLWKMSQAMTAVARDQEDGRRQREIEDIAGKLMDRVKLNQPELV